MVVNAETGWVMLGMEDNEGVFTETTGSEFKGTCLSDPSVCADGITVGLWLKIGKIVLNKGNHQQFMKQH